MIASFNYSSAAACWNEELYRRIVIRQLDGRKSSTMLMPGSRRNFVLRYWAAWRKNALLLVAALHCFDGRVETQSVKMLTAVRKQQHIMHYVDC